MILLLGLIAGLAASSVRVSLAGHVLSPPRLNRLWLVYLAFLPQALFFYGASTFQAPDPLAATGLVVSQLLLIGFAWLNREYAGIRLMGAGVALNLLVIVLNGGLMPVAPETLALITGTTAEGWEIGSRIGKDVVLPFSSTRLWWLSDCLLLPHILPYRVAFSVGDVVLALGVCRIAWAMSEHPATTIAPARWSQQVR